MPTLLFTHFALTGPRPIPVGKVDGNYQLTHGTWFIGNDTTTVSVKRLVAHLNDKWPEIQARARGPVYNFVIDHEIADPVRTWSHYKTIVTTVHAWAKRVKIRVEIYCYLWWANDHLNAQMAPTWDKVARLCDGVCVPIHRDEPSNDDDYREIVLPIYVGHGHSYAKKFKKKMAVTTMFNWIDGATGRETIRTTESLIEDMLLCRNGYKARPMLFAPVDWDKNYDAQVQEIVEGLAA